MNSEKPVRSVLPKSKVIKKKHATDSPESLKGKKYNTFDSTSRKSILSSLRKTLLDMKLVDLGNNPSSNDFLQLLLNMDVHSFNKILNDILKKHVAAFQSDVTTLRRWRRKIKEWVNSSEKPETRGHGLIPHEKLGRFKQHLIPEIMSMPTRSFLVLKQRVFKVFQAIEQPVQTKACSKHWWYTFLERNTDIKEIWEALPKREYKKEYKKEGKRRRSDSSPDTDGDLPIKMEEEFPIKREEKEHKIKTEVKQECDHMPIEDIGVKKEEEKEKFLCKKESISLTMPDFPLIPLAYNRDMKVERLVLKDLKIPKLEEPYTASSQQSKAFLPVFWDHFEIKKEDMIEIFQHVLNWKS